MIQGDIYLWVARDIYAIDTMKHETTLSLCATYKHISSETQRYKTNVMTQDETQGKTYFSIKWYLSILFLLDTRQGTM